MNIVHQRLTEMKIGDNVRIIIEPGHYLATMANSYELNGVITRGNQSIIEVALSDTETYVVDLDDEEIDYKVTRDNQEYLKNKSDQEFVRVYNLESISAEVKVCIHTFAQIQESVVIRNVYFKHK